MAKRKRTTSSENEVLVYAPAEEQRITQTIEKNYMPYVMSVIISRAIPEIDGFKPAHRKLLYTMFKMGLLTGTRTKSANVVGQTMKLNPHGDASIYDTLVRLTRGNASLLHPFIDSKGAFGKQYSSSMAPSAARYTEVKLDKISAEIFEGIDKNAVDFLPNYDNTMQEPVLLPTTFPNILVTPNIGIAVGLASNICPFNLTEICDGTIALLRNPRIETDKMLDIIKAPDFPGGGMIIYDRDAMREVYERGTGPIKIRAKYIYDPDQRCIDIIEIPYSTTIELIIKRVNELVRDGNLKNVTAIRDEIDKDGFKLSINIAKDADPDRIMKKLYKLTTLEDSFKCNFNVLIGSVPKQLGVIHLLGEWIKFRMQCVKRELSFEREKLEKKYHLLMGLGRILLDIDKAIRIIKNTPREDMVVPNLCTGFSIDEEQAEYIAEIKLRHLNCEYLLNRVNEMDSVNKRIGDISDILADDIKVKKLIAEQLTEIKKKYGKPRMSTIIDASEVEVYEASEDIDNFPAHFCFTADGYFKKITLQSLRGNDEQFLKENDRIIFEADGENIWEFSLFTSKGNIYRLKALDFDTCKASSAGDYLPGALGFEDGERIVYVRNAAESTEGHNMVFIFENGKGVRIPMSLYETKAPRKKLTNAFSQQSPIVTAIEEAKASVDIFLLTSAHKAAIISSALIPQKSTKTSSGTGIITLKDGAVLRYAAVYTDELTDGIKGYRKLKIPAAPTTLTDEDKAKLESLTKH